MADIERALGKGGKDKPDEVTVHVRHLGEHEKESFKAELGWTLQQLWDRAYEELAIAKSDRDVLKAPSKPNPIDLMPHLGQTFQAARAQNLCDREFEIAAGTGGA
jgi:hypothetical protein